ncbi:hypothetical protein DL89DRAFT_295189 [Linderina pennispora]|uniref:MMS19 nucleotide excision repair protein n=1 Tax=Linderina pennispora TaxID=61395 RepID=A0A1Y1W0R1_9FUNG|nr:uncharacterized protein DL89DRAFT_295189 [Linderina pennispora]ORX66826.1 hypothetical protein DL89DRAFT_295189 [Linderina pennispora]
MDLQRVVDAYVIGIGESQDNTELLNKLVTHISAGDTSLLELVQALGDHLASDEATRRSRGTHILSDVLGELPAAAVPARATTMLTQFFCARLGDATCVPQTLRALMALLRLPAFTSQYAIDVVSALFKEVHVQSFQQSTRSTAYSLLQTVVDGYPKAVQSIGDDFVLGFAQALDGEKDPRSLMVAFELVPRIIELVDIEKYAEDLFDNRDGDPSAISPEALKRALRACIAGSPYFGELAVKPLVSKTTATSVSAKIDAYETLAAGARVYEPSVFLPRMEALVDQIREEVFMAADEDVVRAALGTLEAVYAVISVPPASAKPCAMEEDATPLDYILKEASIQLTADEIKNPEEVGRILRAAAKSSSYNCAIVTDAILPVIAERLSSTEVLTVRRQLIDVLNHVLPPVPLDKEYSVLHMVRLKGITLLVLLPGLLTDNEAAVALTPNVNKEATHLLVQLSLARHELVSKVVLPKLIEALTADTVAASKVARLLDVLGAVAVASRSLVATIVTSICEVLITGLQPAFRVAAMTTVRKIIDATLAAKSDPELVTHLAASVMQPVAQWMLQLVGQQESVPLPLVVEFAKCEVALFSNLDAAAQEKTGEYWFDTYRSVIVDASNAQAEAKSLLPLWRFLIVAAFLGDLSHAALATENAIQRDACFEIISSVVNKTKDAKVRAQLVQTVLDKAVSADSPADPLVLLHQWIARALVTCNDRLGYDSVRWLFGLIDAKSELSTQAAEGFSVILGDHDWSVTKPTHGVFRLLFKQRFYATVLPEITARFNAATDDVTKAAFLVVLTNVIRHMPKSVLMNGIETVVPLLLSAVRPDPRRAELCLWMLDALQKSEANTVDVRRAALETLALVPEKYDIGVLHSVRHTILKVLTKTRDDHKRLVRLDAVRGYNKWLNFGDV